MVREDIVGGLKNALERGHSIESAKQSFINAGYSADEVNEAVNYLGADSVLIMKQPTPIGKPQNSIQPSKNNALQPKNFSNKNPPTNPPLNADSSNPPANKNAQINNQPIVEKVPVLKKQEMGFFQENWKIIALISILVILIVVFVLVLLFSDTIASWFA